MENLDTVIDFIIEHSLIQKGDRVGVATSGGADSMALLHFLHSIHKEAGFEIMAVHVNHSIRANSKKDALFVAKYCRENKIDLAVVTVDVPTYARIHKMGVEQAARVLRYQALDSVAKKKKLNKIALGHHQNDQAETILMHIFRGAGPSGASGMLPTRDHYIRPFLEIARPDIVEYNYRHKISFVEDPSNKDDTYSRNFIRNQIMPLIEREWRGAQKNIVDFGKNCQKDENYMCSLVHRTALNISENVVRIPLSLFHYHDAVVNRVIFGALDELGERENIERKHIKMMTALARTGENGARVDLPKNLFAVREYEYLAVVKRIPPSVAKVFSFKIGKTIFPEFGTVNVKKTISFKDAVTRGEMVLDVDAVPKGAKWRTRRDADQFSKFGGGTKPLNAYLIDKKIPNRLRDKIPVLAVGSEILAIAGIEIADKVRVGPRTLEAYIVEVIKD
ncbi:MAG: tRNA lysidine(34) synthetase TilS [Firmicutes bacterium]|nr:tRNA lysidine(34) synthetase TilS [Bacillota bacterium]